MFNLNKFVATDGVFFVHLFDKNKPEKGGTWTTAVSDATIWKSADDARAALQRVNSQGYVMSTAGFVPKQVA